MTAPRVLSGPTPARTSGPSTVPISRPTPPSACRDSAARASERADAYLGNQAFLLSEVACSAARERQLGRSITSLVAALALGALFIVTDGRRRRAREKPPVAVAV